MCLSIISYLQKACTVLAGSSFSFFSMHMLDTPPPADQVFELPYCFWFFLNCFHIRRFCVEWADGQDFPNNLKSSYGEVHSDYKGLTFGQIMGSDYSDFSYCGLVWPHTHILRAVIMENTEMMALLWAVKLDTILLFPPPNPINSICSFF